MSNCVPVGVLRTNACIKHQSVLYLMSENQVSSSICRQARPLVALKSKVCVYREVLRESEKASDANTRTVFRSVCKSDV